MNAMKRYGSEPVTIDDLDEALEAYSIQEMARFKVLVDDTVKAATAQILYAFPDGVENHRESHQAMIDAARAEKEFWIDLRHDVAKKSIWGILHILGVLALGTLAVKLGIGSVFGLGK